jgi:hypothetical protein
MDQIASGINKVNADFTMRGRAALVLLRYQFRNNMERPLRRYLCSLSL